MSRAHRNRLLLTLPLLLAACNQPTTVTTSPNPPVVATPSHPVVTFSPTVQGIADFTLGATLDGQAISTTLTPSLTQTRGATIINDTDPTWRYISTVFTIRNASTTTAQSNITLFPIATTPGTTISTIGVTPFRSLTNGGVDLPSARALTVASGLQPTHGITSSSDLTLGQASFQAYNETEINNLNTALAGPSSANLAATFPYGFVVAKANGSRTLAPGESGTVTVTYRVRKDGGTLPDSLTFRAAVTTDNAVRVTRGVTEGQANATGVSSRADARGGNVEVALIGQDTNGASCATATCTTIRLVNVRTAGTFAQPVAYLLNAPRISEIPDRTAAPGSTVTFTVTATDLSGEAPTLSASGLPSGATFDANTGVFKWTPSNQQTGDTFVTFKATNRDGSFEEQSPLIEVTAAVAPTAFTVQSGDDQIGTVGQVAPAPLKVKATGEGGAAAGGVPVTWSVTNGNGTVSSTSSLTDTNGEASTNLTLGITPGLNRVTATAEGFAPVTFTLYGNPETAVSISKVSGDGNAAPNTQRPVQVKVVDASNNPVENYTLRFAVASGEGSLSTLTATTNAAGIAETTWTLGSVVGAQSVTATAPGLSGSPLTFNVTTDLAPTVTLSSPSNGATDVAVNTPITVTFSESVAATTSSFTLMCSGVGGPIPFTLSASPSNAYTLTPTANLPGNATCTVTVNANQISDSDAIDPPDNMMANYAFSFMTFAPTASNDSLSENVLGNVAVDTSRTSFSVLTNDTINASTTLGGASWNNVGGKTEKGGDVTLVSSGPNRGTFTYNPPAGYEGADKFNYTLSYGGATATGTVSLTVNGMVWFIDSESTAATADGRFGTPFKTLSAFQAVNNGQNNNPASNDTIFLYSGPSNTSYTGPLTLLGGQKLIGQGATASLASIAEVTWPTASGAQVATSGTRPSITASNANAVTLNNANTSNTLRGFNIGNVGSSGTALEGSTFGTLNVSEVDINTNGRALNLSGGTLTGSFATLRSTGGVNNILLTNVATNNPVTLNNPSGASVLGSSTDFLSGASGDAVKIDGGNGSFTIPSSVTNNTSLAVNITNKSGGTVAFSGTLNPFSSGRGISVTNNNTGANTIIFSGQKWISSGAATGVNLVNNSGATISFTNGGLRVSTTTGRGINATGGGTLSVVGSENMILSAGGIALNVQSTNIASSGLNFSSINASGGANGIVLDTTGSTGGLTVSGTGVAGSGGAILSTSGSDGAVAGNGVYLKDTKGVNLSWMQLKDHSNHAIYGSNVSNVTLTQLAISGVNGTNAGFNEGSVSFDNLTGAASITSSSISGGFEDNIRVFNTSGTLNRIVLDTVTIGHNSASGNDGVLLEASGTATLNATMRNSTFTGSRSNNVHYVLTGNASGDFVFSNNTLSNNHPNKLGSDFGINVGSTSNGAMTYTISGNSVRDAGGSGIEVTRLAGGSGAMTGSITSNTVGVSGVSNSGSNAGSAIVVGIVGAGTAATHNATVTGNTLRQYANYGLRLINRGTGTGYLNASVKNNNIAEPGPNATAFGAYSAMRAELGASSTGPDDGKSCLDISGNTLNQNAGSTQATLRIFGRFATKTALPGLTAAGANAFLAAQNTITGTNTAVNASSTNAFQSSCPPV